MDDLIIACPFFNRPNYVAKTLESLHERVGDKYKVWLFDDCSSVPQDYVTQKCSQLKNWRVFKKPERGGMVSPYPGMLQFIANTVKDKSHFLVLIDSDFTFSSQWEAIVLQAIETVKIHPSLISLVNIIWDCYHRSHGDVTINGLPLSIKKEIKSGSLILSNTSFCRAVNEHICDWNPAIGNNWPWDHMICDYFAHQKWGTYSTRVSYADHFGAEGLSGVNWVRSIDFVP